MPDEGAVAGSAVGTYLRGPCLPRNPALADFLIQGALTRRHGEADLAPLEDDLERAAHDVAADRAMREQPAGRRHRRIGVRGRPERPRAGPDGAYDGGNILVKKGSL